MSIVQKRRFQKDSLKRQRKEKHFWQRHSARGFLVRPARPGLSRTIPAIFSLFNNTQSLSSRLVFTFASDFSHLFRCWASNLPPPKQGCTEEGQRLPRSSESATSSKSKAAKETCERAACRLPSSCKITGAQPCVFTVVDGRHS